MFTDAVISRTPVRRRIAGIAAVGALLTVLASCVALDTALPAPDPASSSSVPGSDVSPAPGRTVDATPPADLDGLQGVRIAVVVPGSGDATRALQDAVHRFAQEHHLVVDEFAATEDPASVDAAFAQAVATEPHVVVGLGAGAVDAFAYTSSQFLDQDFLLIGAQVAEPTSNVTAVVWQGATSRGSGAPADGDLDDGLVTGARAEDAMSVGLSTVMSGTTGIVLHLPG